MTRAQEAEERFGLKREVAKFKRLMSKKYPDLLSDEDSKKSEEDNNIKTDENNKGEYEGSMTSTISENQNEECNDVTDGGDKRTKDQISPDKVFLEVCICKGLDIHDFMLR